MQLQTWVIEDDSSRAIIIATSNYYAQRYAEQMGYTGKLMLIDCPTVYITPLEPVIYEKV